MPTVSMDADLVFRLPISGLPERYRSIDRGAVAALLVDDWECAVRLAVSCCLSSPAKRDLILAGAQAQRQAVLFAQQREAQYDFSSVTVRTAQHSFLANRCPLRELGFSLPYVLEGSHSAVIICDASEVPLEKADDLLVRLQELATCARESRHSLLLIFHCSKRLEFHLQMNACRSALSGLCECMRHDGGLLWKTIFWNCLNQYSGEFNGLLVDADDELGFVCHTEDRGDLLAVNDADAVWSSSSKITPRTCKISNLHSLKNNEELFRIGLQASSAMLIFSLTQSADIPHVGRHIHELRVRRGRYLRIAVVEDSKPMRSSTMAFLLSCGANIVFDSNATADYIRLMVTSLKGSIYPHAPLANFEQALQAIIGEHQTGLVPSDKFLTFVEAEVSCHADWLDAHGALVILTPAPGLTNQECMEHFHPKRSGDFGTYTNDMCLIYLPGCLSGFVELALTRCFVLRPADLFSSYRAVYDDMEILALLKQTRNRSLEAVHADNENFSSQLEMSQKPTQAPTRQLLQPNSVRPRLLEEF